jgi:hypothetical protein
MFSVIAGVRRDCPLRLGVLLSFFLTKLSSPHTHRNEPCRTILETLVLLYTGGDTRYGIAIDSPIPS